MRDTIPEADIEKERTRIAYQVTAAVPMALDEDELTQSVLLQDRQSASV